MSDRSWRQWDALAAELRRGAEELKFIRSPQDVKIFYEKIAYMLPRLSSGFNETAAPPSLQLEPTNYCNSRCICCPTHRLERPRGFLNMDLFHKVVDEAAEIGVKRIQLYYMGEPMLHPRILDMVAYIKAKGLACHFTTNGMLFTPQKIEGLLRAGVDSADTITFSILGNTKEVHELVQKRIVHERVVHNALSLIEMREKLKINGPVVEAIYYVMPENEAETEDFLKFWRGKVDHARVGGRIISAFADYKENAAAQPMRDKTCSLLWERMVIMWDGSVTQCTADVDGEYIFGNVKDSSIQSLWNNEALVELRRKHKQKQFEQLPMCTTCDW